ncbi:MAG: DASH family cryptochrome [Bdellovibrionales bacterium]|nr:DASH family cryptochrome [Bdellovibrionales bacterium]
MKSAIWFTNDLRVYDNKVVAKAIEQSSSMIGFFILPNLQSQPQKTFLMESLEDLALQLKAKEIPLFLFNDAEVSVVADLVRKNNITRVYSAKALNSRKKSWQREVVQTIPDVQFKELSSEILLDLPSLEMSENSIDDHFTSFRKKVESRWFVPACTETPKSIPQPWPLDDDHKKYVVLPGEVKQRSLSFTGGRSAGLNRLHYYLFESQRIKTYKETRNGMLAFDDSSKLSPWLAQGCISPREVYWAIKKFEGEVQANESTYWLVFELLWRDYFKFLSVKYQDKFFRRQGISSKPYLSENSQDSENVFELWKAGKTKNDFINANMIELLKTGWMSNRGRQNVASYLVKTLKIDWTWGADWFERNLMDYDCENNWGNWLYQSGRGTDPRDRVFNPDLQAEMYDPQGEYRRKWLQG